MDNALRHLRGSGLAAFLPTAPGEGQPPVALSRRPCLVLSFDEGSPNLALSYWLLYKARIRALAIRDVFHREWNDCQGAVKGAGLWWVVIATTLIYNLGYGPWQGSAWFHRMSESASDMVHRAGAQGELFRRLVADIVRYRGGTPTGTQEQEVEILQSFAASEGFSRKGPRVALRRWFSWFQSAQVNDRVWHSRLLSILHLGMVTKVYRHSSHTPLWRKGVGAATEPAEDSESDREAAADRDQAARVAIAVPNSAAASSSGGIAGEPESRAVPQSNVDVDALRKKCRNTLFVAAELLAQPDLQVLARLIYLVGAPFYDSHSYNAGVAKGEAGTLDFYVSAACGAWAAPI